MNFDDHHFCKICKSGMSVFSDYESEAIGDFNPRDLEKCPNWCRKCGATGHSESEEECSWFSQLSRFAKG